jgi:WD40 repeat protein
MNTNKVKPMRNGLVVLGLAILAPLAVQAQDVPRYKVDPSWPKELPNNWILGRVGGIAVDKNDHIWVLHSPSWVLKDEAGAAQNPPLSECCVPAPAVLEFDSKGNVLKSWGGRGFVPDWPTQEMGLGVDKDGNVWMGGTWTGGYNASPTVIGPDRKDVWDRQVLKFSSDGKLLMEIGHPTTSPANNEDTTILGGPTRIVVDEAAHEAYISDGTMNKRVVVYDSNTGAFKRGWGAYGVPLNEISAAKLPPYDPEGPPAKQFRSQITLALSADGLVYVGDRTGNRIQVFTKQGKFVLEYPVAPKTIGRGSVWGIAFSHDAKQKYLLVADGGDCVVRILDRSSGKEVGKFGHRGANAGQFNFIQDLAMDSQGNIYTGEVNTNYRVQKFVLQK